MAYKITKYGDFDLKMKPDRYKGVRNDMATSYAQQALTDLGYPCTKDGDFGPKTQAAVRAFQADAGLTVNGVLDQFTWDNMDWRVYEWYAAPSTYTSAGDRGRAIVKGKNKYTGLPVNTNGQTREGQRGSDVGEAQFRKSLGWEGAVDRARAGSGGSTSLSSLSWHATGLAGDDMADQDKDRKIDPEELYFMEQMKDLYFMRAQGFPHVYSEITLRDGVNTLRKNRGWRGRDRLCTIVIGNKQLPNGQWIEPGCTHNRDTSWSAARNTFKSLSGTTHIAPFHLHTDFAPGAPIGRQGL